MFARPIDMEPGMKFLCRGSGMLTFVGVERVASRFAHKRVVRVLVRPGPSFVVDRDVRYPLVGD
jgi:hypothetical protein